MSGFRKFRTTLHRRRKSMEAELGSFTSSLTRETAGRVEASGGSLGDGLQAAEGALEGSTAPLEFSVSAEAREIGPSPIVWMKPKRSETDN